MQICSDFQLSKRLQTVCRMPGTDKKTEIRGGVFPLCHHVGGGRWKFGSLPLCLGEYRAPSERLWLTRPGAISLPDTPTPQKREIALDFYPAAVPY